MPARPAFLPLLIFTALLLAGVLAVVGWHYYQEKQSRPGNRRVVLTEVKLTRHRPGLPAADAVVHGWFDIVAVIENREPREVIVDCSTAEAALVSNNGGGGPAMKDPSWRKLYTLRPGESAVLIDRLSGHFSKDATSLQLTLKTDGVEQVLERIIDKDW